MSHVYPHLELIIDDYCLAKLLPYKYAKGMPENLIKIMSINQQDTVYGF
jgi:hypothetical protein